jgi:hypothetical protein
MRHVPLKSKVEVGGGQNLLLLDGSGHLAGWVGSSSRCRVFGRIVD